MHLSKLAEVYTENGEFALSQLLHNENEMREHKHVSFSLKGREWMEQVEVVEKDPCQHHCDHSSDT